MLVGMKAYSLDLRQKILRAYDQRLGSQRAIAALFGVSQLFVEKPLQQRRIRGDMAPRPPPVAGVPSVMRRRLPWCAASCKSTPMPL